MKKSFLIKVAAFILLAAFQFAGKGTDKAFALGGDTFTHDPAIIYEDGTYYMFYTAPYIGYKTSDDGENWSMGRKIFKPSSYPAWWKGKCPDDFNIWAPDVTKIGDTFYLYYCVSKFGTNNSTIGLLTSTDLKTWKDEGQIFKSTASDRYNCIDPNLVKDYEGNYYLSFGSFWSGIFIVPLESDAKTVQKGAKAVNLAGRVTTEIEAPFIWTPGNGYYYLFVSFDRCCQGVNSTYSIHYGRSESPLGPFLDQRGKKMLKGAGDTVLSTKANRIGPGGQSVFKDKDGNYVLAYHYYDRNLNGRATLGLLSLELDEDGWLVSDTLNR